MKKCDCGKDAVWCYSTGFPNVDNTYFCDDCVSSADDDPCSCQYKPISFYDKPKGMEFGPDEQQELLYLHAMAQAEQNYFKLLTKGWTPQQARSVLPNSLKTELIMTGFDSDWEGFFKLRDDSHAHPQAFELAHPLHEKFIKLGIKKNT